MWGWCIKRSLVCNYTNIGNFLSVANGWFAFIQVLENENVQAIKLNVITKENELVWKFEIICGRRTSFSSIKATFKVIAGLNYAATLVVYQYSLIFGSVHRLSAIMFKIPWSAELPTKLPITHLGDIGLCL